MNFHRANLIGHICEQTNWSKEQAEEAIDAVFGGVIELTKQRKLVIRGFGTFSLRRRKACVTVHPQTGRSIQSPATTRLGLKGAAPERETAQ